MDLTHEKARDELGDLGGLSSKKECESDKKFSKEHVNGRLWRPVIVNHTIGDTELTLAKLQDFSAKMESQTHGSKKKIDLIDNNIPCVFCITAFIAL